jgi:hypothetical protein
MIQLRRVATMVICLLLSLGTFAQKSINLGEHFNQEKIQALNRVITLYAADKNAVELNAENSDGLGILQGVAFETGIIEVELLGENNPGKSFIGIAFNIQDKETYEVIYFRPFNFVAQEQIRRDHMVQYIFHPEFTWRKLRAERTGEFENEISNPPNPDNWFKATIQVMEKEVKVYVNENSEPVLVVPRLSTPGSNKLGIWTGYGSSGRFRNLVIK